jgi:hypothetical protein
VKARLALILIVAFAGILRASDNSVEVALEDAAEHQASKDANRWKRWKFQPKKGEPDWKDFGQWRYKFYTGSDKELGSAADTAAIKALVPSTMPTTIRWISRSIVVVAADCDAVTSPSGFRCLYVVEKRRSKWKTTHQYPRPFGNYL